MDDDWGRSWVHFYSGAIAEKEFIGIFVKHFILHYCVMVIRLREVQFGGSANPICFTSNDYRPNWKTRSPIKIYYYKNYNSENELKNKRSCGISFKRTVAVKVRDSTLPRAAPI